MFKLSNNNLLIFSCSFLLIALFSVLIYFFYSPRSDQGKPETNVSDKTFVASEPILILQTTCEHGQTKPTIIFSRPETNLEVGSIEYSTDSDFTTAQKETFTKGQSEVKVTFSNIDKESVGINARWKYEISGSEGWSDTVSIRIDPCS